MKPLRLTQLLFLLLVVTGCGGGGGGSKGPSSEPKPLDTKRQSIGPSGGQVELPGVGRVIAKPSALAATTTVELASYRGTDYPINVLLDPAVKTIEVRIDRSALAAESTFDVEIDQPTRHERAFGIATNWKGDYEILERVPSERPESTTLRITRDALQSLGGSQAIARLNVTVFDFEPAPLKIDLPWRDVMVRLTPERGAADLANDNWDDDDMWDGFDSHSDRVTENGRVAIVIHGMSNDIKAVTNLAYYLHVVKRADGAPVYTDVLGFEYTWTESIDDNGDHLAQIVDRIKRRYPNVPIDLFGHSMGGLVARWAIEHGDRHGSNSRVGLGGDIDRLFTFGTPHVGVPFKALEPLLVLYRRELDGGMRDLPPGIEDLSRDGPFIKALNQSPSTSSRSTTYTAFAGQATDYMGVVGKAIQKVYQWISPIDLPSDGIVSIHSAQNEILIGRARTVVRDRSLVFPLNHSDVVGKYVAAGAGYDLSTVFNQPEARSLATHVALHGPAAPGAWVRWARNGHWYKAMLVPGGVSWPDAKSRAEAEGAQLVSLESEEENRFVFSMIDDSRWWLTAQGTQFGPWIGLYQLPGSTEPAGGWTWVDGKPLSYSGWYTGEPNNQTGNENAALYASKVGQRAPTWNDGHSSTLLGSYVMERSTPP